MNLPQGRTLLVSGAATVAAAYGLLTQGPTVWNSVGWTTPAQHVADVGNVELMQDSIEEALAGEIKAFREEWRCDELAESLLELLRQQQAGDNSVETAEEITRIRGLINDKYDCSRFDE